MKELEPFGNLDELVNKVDERKIVEARVKLSQLGNECDPAKVRSVVEEINNWIDHLIPLKDNEVYDKYRQRLFKTVDGKMISFAGKEIDVDVRRRRKK